MRIRNNRALKTIICISMSVLLITGCKAQTTKTQEPTDIPPLSYTFYDGLSFRPLSWYEKDDLDGVTNYIEQKFDISVSKVYYNKGLSFQERFNQLLASDELPDVITVQQENSFFVANSGFYAELGPLIKAYMPNLLKWCPKEKWEEALIDGKMYGIPNPWIDTTTETYADDIYIMPASNWTLFTREDILSQLGYEFDSMNELALSLESNQSKLFSDQLAINPSIDTPEKLIDFLRKIKTYGMESGQADLIPLGIPWWLQGHLGYMFGMTNGWHYDSNQYDIHAYLGNPNAKDYYRFLNQLYREGLLDHEMLSQEDYHLENKWASGSVAVGMWLNDSNVVQEQLFKKSETDYLRPIEFPKVEGMKSTGIDHYSPTTFQTFIRKDFEDIPRLLSYFDWMLSDEGLEIATWGPEEDGFWEMENGKKVFSDVQMREAYFTGKPNDKRPELYGLGYDSSGSILASRAIATGISLRGYNPFAIERSYPIDIKDDAFYRLAYHTLATENLDRYGLVREGVDELTTAPTNYMWDEFYPQKSILLIAAATEEEFEYNWEIIFNDFIKAVNYYEGKEVMKKIYMEAGYVVID